MKSVVSLLSVLILGLASAFSVAVESAPNAASTAKTEVVAKQGTININTADALELTKLKGVGPKKAEAIVAWRKANGDFKSVEQLLEVKGIGEATLMQNRENIRI